MAPLTLLLTGCQAPSHTAEMVVVLPSATANEPAPMLAAADRALLYHAGATSTRGVAYVINPATGQPTRVGLTPVRADGQVEYGSRRDYLLSQSVNRVQQVLRTEAATGPFDLLQMIASAVRVTSHPGTLLILSSGLSTAGGFNLRDGRLGRQSADRRRATQAAWPAAPAGRVAAGLLRAGGCVRPAARAAAAAAHHAHRVLAGHLPRRRGRRLPHRRHHPARPGVTQHDARAGGAGPGGHSVTGPRHSAGLSVPADELFAFNSASLLGGADGILRPLIGRARAQHQFVSITGYASPDGGSAAYNLALSQARALAVRNRLVALGLPPSQIGQVTGLGTAGQPARACDRDGQLDEALCAGLRRVVILLIPQPRPRPDRLNPGGSHEHSRVPKPARRPGRDLAVPPSASTQPSPPGELPEDPFADGPAGPRRGGVAARARQRTRTLVHRRFGRLLRRRRVSHRRLVTALLAEDDHIAPGRDLDRATHGETVVQARRQGRGRRRAGPVPAPPGAGRRRDR